MAEMMYTASTNFNPRSSCEERQCTQEWLCTYGNFNPRSSCEERLENTVVYRVCLEFQSTLLMRGATQ